MNFRKYCPKFVFPFLQRAAALPDIIMFSVYKRKYSQNPLGVLTVSPTRKSVSGNLEYISRALAGSEFTVSHLNGDDCLKRKKRLKALAENKFILLDDYTRFIYPLKFKKGTRLVQVWHSTGAFKRMGFARMGRSGSTLPTSLTHRNYTHVIVSSPSVAECFCEAFGVTQDKIYPIGIPRTDLFFNGDAKREMISEFYRKYPMLRGKRLVLFAPTFRGDTKEKAYYPREWFDPAELISRLPEDYALGIKLHPFIKEKIGIPQELCDRVFDFSSEREINPLLLVTDTLITDYSSVIFEYALLDKNIVFYLPDLSEYDRDRSFFYDISEYIYGTVCKSRDGLSEAVSEPRSIPFKKEEFFNRFLQSCDGNSTERFVNEILRK